MYSALSRHNFLSPTILTVFSWLLTGTGLVNSFGYYGKPCNDNFASGTVTAIANQRGVLS